MKISVYLHTSTVTGKAYVGITLRTVELRFREHCQHALLQNSQFQFHRAIRKHGKDAWLTETLHVVDTWEEAQALEQAEIAARDTFRNGYNATLGGDGAIGRPMTPENREALSQRFQERWEDPEYRERMSTINIGFKHDEVSRAKRSAKLKGREITPEWREKLREAAMKRSRHGNTKTWIVTHPDGREEVVPRLSEWCKQNDIKLTNMQNVANGNIKAHRGFTLRKASPG